MSKVAESSKGYKRSPSERDGETGALEVAPKPAQSQAPSRTLIVPAVAVGNVGQVACDLISRKLGKAHRNLDHEGCLTPCVGRSASGLATPLQISEIGPECSCLVVKSMIVPGKSREFARLVLRVAKEEGFTRILVVGAASALALVNDAQILRTRDIPRVIAKNPPPEGFIEMEYRVEELKLAGLLPFLKNEALAFGTEVEALLSFIFEGDNVPDGERMASFACAYLGRAISG
jgi:proteasome assembly chaperone 2